MNRPQGSSGVPASPSGSRRSGRASKAVSPPDGASIPNADRFAEHARELIEAKLLNHPDEGVRAITAMFGVPDEAVERVAAKLQAEAGALAEMPDEEIDCSDIPETTDWSGAVRGMFRRVRDRNRRP